jgi:hypothetical protein
LAWISFPFFIIQKYSGIETGINYQAFHALSADSPHRAGELSLIIDKRRLPSFEDIGMNACFSILVLAQGRKLWYVVSVRSGMRVYKSSLIVLLGIIFLFIEDVTAAEQVFKKVFIAGTDDASDITIYITRSAGEADRSLYLTRNDEAVDKKLYLTAIKSEADYVIEFTGTAEDGATSVCFADTAMEADVSVYFTRDVDEADTSVLFVHSRQDAHISVFVEDTGRSRNQILAILAVLKII